MEISYDPECNIAYIRLRAKTDQVESIQISEELVLDLAPDGRIYGIELLNANEQLAQEGPYLFIINTASQSKNQVSLDWTTHS